MAARDEYNTIIRIDHRALPPIPYTHALILDSEPTHIVRFCRTMTLAQGRILYQLWDDTEFWQPRPCGYIVPASIANEARRISVRDRAEDWKGLHPLRVQAYGEAWDAVVKAWPGIPIFGARRAVEELVARGRGNRRAEVDGAVVRYARREWTNYKARLEAKRVVRERDVVEHWKVVREIEGQVAGRLREVLERWTRVGVALPLEFFERGGNGVVDVPKKQSSIPYRKFL